MGVREIMRTGNIQNVGRTNLPPCYRDQKGVSVQESTYLYFQTGEITCQGCEKVTQIAVLAPFLLYLLNKTIINQVGDY